MKRIYFALATLSILDGTYAMADETGPVPLAKSFMVQFYGVNPDAVSVKSISDSPSITTVVAQADEHACKMEMSPAPKGTSARFGWLVGSMQCDNIITSKKNN